MFSDFLSLKNSVNDVDTTKLDAKCYIYPKTFKTAFTDGLKGFLSD